LRRTSGASDHDHDHEHEHENERGSMRGGRVRFRQEEKQGPENEIDRQELDAFDPVRFAIALIWKRMLTDATTANTSGRVNSGSIGRPDA
jgi:hypothetical protein